MPLKSDTKSIWILYHFPGTLTQSQPTRHCITLHRRNQGVKPIRISSYRRLLSYV